MKWNFSNRILAVTKLRGLQLLTASCMKFPRYLTTSSVCRHCTSNANLSIPSMKCGQSSQVCQSVYAVSFASDCYFNANSTNALTKRIRSPNVMPWLSHALSLCLLSSAVVVAIIEFPVPV